MEALIYRSDDPAARLVLTDEFPGREGFATLFYELLGYPGGRTTFRLCDRLPKGEASMGDILDGWFAQTPITNGSWGPVTPEAVDLAHRFAGFYAIL